MTRKVHVSRSIESNLLKRCTKRAESVVTLRVHRYDRFQSLDLTVQGEVVWRLGLLGQGTREGEEQARQAAQGDKRQGNWTWGT